MARSALALLMAVLMVAMGVSAQGTTSVSPTTYTVSGVVVTFEPTTWATPSPTYRSGSIEAVSDYFKTYTALGAAASA